MAKHPTTDGQRPIRIEGRWIRINTLAHRVLQVGIICNRHRFSNRCVANQPIKPTQRTTTTTTTTPTHHSWHSLSEPIPGQWLECANWFLSVLFFVIPFFCCCCCCCCCLVLICPASLATGELRIANQVLTYKNKRKGNTLINFVPTHE